MAKREVGQYLQRNVGLFIYLFLLQEIRICFKSGGKGSLGKGGIDDCWCKISETVAQLSFYPWTWIIFSYEVRGMVTW